MHGSCASAELLGLGVAPFSLPFSLFAGQAFKLLLPVGPFSPLPERFFGQADTHQHVLFKAAYEGGLSFRSCVLLVMHARDIGWISWWANAEDCLRTEETVIVVFCFLVLELSGFHRQCAKRSSLKGCMSSPPCVIL